MKGRSLPFLFFLFLALLLMFKTFLRYVFLPADMLFHFLPWREVGEGRELQWNPLLWDSLAQFYPWRHYLASSLKQGIIPLWNPYQFCGAPFLANGQSAVFYPFNWLLLIFPPPFFFGINAILHLALAGFFTYILLRRLGASDWAGVIGGTAFMLSGFVTAWLALPTVISSFVWLPLALFGVEEALQGKLKRSFLLIALSTTLSLLGGHPQFFLYFLFSLLLYLLLRIPMEGRVSLLGVLVPLLALFFGLALGGIHLLPTFELSRLAHRVEAISWQSYNAYISRSLPPQRLLTLLLPNFFGNPASNNYWGEGEFMEYCLYMGVLPLLLLPFLKIRDKRSLPFLILAILSLLLIIGTPLNIPFYFLVPAWSRTGSPARLISLFSLSLALLAGLGADNLLRAPALPKRLLYLSSFLFLLALLSLFIPPNQALAYIRGVSPSFPYFDLVKVFLIISLFLLLLRFKPKFLPPLLLILLLFDLIPFAVRNLYFSPREKLFPSLSLLQGLRDPQGRVLSLTPRWSLVRYPPACLPPNTAMVYGLLDVGGYDSFFPLAYKSFLDSLEGKDTAPPENGNMLLPSSLRRETLKALGVRYVISPLFLDAKHLQLVKGGETKVYLFQEGERASLLGEGKVRIVRDSPNGVECEVEGKGGLLILRDTLYPGWRAFLDGRRVKVYPYLVFRSVEVPAGRHRVDFLFLPTSYKIGGYLSFLSIFLLFMLIFRRWRN